MPPDVLPLRAKVLRCCPPPSVPQFPFPTGEWQYLCWGLESLGLWLQIPGQVTEDKHRFPDRVRLPRSLFASLQGSRSVVRLAISVLNISTGDVFKVRRSWMLAQGSAEVQQAMLALCGVFPEEPSGTGGGDKPLEFL